MPCANTDADWESLSEKAAKAARWLDYLPFEQIVDQRSAPPQVHIFNPPTPSAYIEVGAQVKIPEAYELRPHVAAHGFEGVQPYRLVMPLVVLSPQHDGPMRRLRVTAFEYLPRTEANMRLLSLTARHESARVVDDRSSSAHTK